MHSPPTEAQWDRAIGTSGLPILHVSYEDLVASREETVRSVLRFLGVPDVDSCAIPEATLVRQRGRFTESWVEIYRQVRTSLEPLGPSHVWSAASRGYVVANAQTP